MNTKTMNIVRIAEKNSGVKSNTLGAFILIPISVSYKPVTVWFEFMQLMNRVYRAEGKV